MTTTLLVSLICLVVSTWLCWQVGLERAIKREHLHLTTGRYEVARHRSTRHRNIRRRASAQH